jgi:hypothetical protein
MRKTPINHSKAYRAAVKAIKGSGKLHIQGQYLTKKTIDQKFKTGKQMTPKQIALKVKRVARKTGVSEREAMKATHAHAFPGVYKAIDKNAQYKDGQIGLFTQSIKGMKGKKFVENAFQQTLSTMMKTYGREGNVW